LKKIFIFQGGFLTACCPHKVVYALKPLVRSESVRDHVDVLLSFVHMPTVTINDLPNMTSRHGNIRFPGMFSPDDGRLAEPTEGNINAVKNGHFMKSLVCLDFGSV
jgi:hypothetical protein